MYIEIDGCDVWQPAWRPASLMIPTSWHSSPCSPQDPHRAGVTCITSRTLWKETWFSAVWFSHNTQAHRDLGEVYGGE